MFDPTHRYLRRPFLWVGMIIFGHNYKPIGFQSKMCFATSGLCWEVKTLNACSLAPIKTQLAKHTYEIDRLILPSSISLSSIPAVKFQMMLLKVK